MLFKGMHYTGVAIPLHRYQAQMRKHVPGDVLAKPYGRMLSMEKRKKLIAANWKMYPAPVALGAPVQGKPSMEALKAYRGTPEVDAIVFPTFLDIPKVLKAGLIVGAQYGHPEESGAHTGDVSMKMVKDAGCTHV